MFVHIYTYKVHVYVYSCLHLNLCSKLPNFIHLSINLSFHRYHSSSSTDYSKNSHKYPGLPARGMFIHPPSEIFTTFATHRPCSGAESGAKSRQENGIKIASGSGILFGTGNLQRPAPDADLRGCIFPGGPRAGGHVLRAVRMYICLKHERLAIARRMNTFVLLRNVMRSPLRKRPGLASCRPIRGCVTKRAFYG